LWQPATMTIATMTMGSQSSWLLQHDDFCAVLQVQHGARLCGPTQSAGFFTAFR
jgi:hypothetical protein